MSRIARTLALASIILGATATIALAGGVCFCLYELVAMAAG